MSGVRLYAVLLAAVVLGVPLASGAADQLAAPTIDTHPANPTNATSASFTFSDTDPTATSFQCQIDGGGFGGCTSPKTYGPLAAGSHTFDVKALDSLLNPSDIVSYTWLIDTVAPTITLSTKPPNPSNDATPTFAFTADEPTPGGFQCKLDAGAFTACVSPTTFGATADGLHTFTVRATDAAGNLGQTSYAWTIDTVAPALSLTAKPPNPSGVSTAHFEFGATDQTSVTYQCQLDGGALQGCTSPKDYSGLPNGTHTFTLKGTDAAGNSSTTSYTWLVDLVNPLVAIADRPRNPTNQTGASLSFSSNKNPGTFQCQLDGEAFSTCTSPKTYGPLGEGAHSFSVKATDLLNHTGPTANFSWVIDLTPPPAPSVGSGPANPTNETNASFVFSDSEVGVTFGCQLDGGAFSACTSPAAYSELAAVAHTFAVGATDPAGNTGAAASYGWTVKDTTAPGDVSGLKRTIGYRILKLAWSRPPDADFDYVRVLAAKGSKGAKGQPRTLVYKGTGTRYTNKRFQNGTYYRYAIISYDHAGNASRGIPVVVPPSALLSSPKDGVVVHAPPRLVWAEVAKATFYNVQLYFGGKKILSAWPSASRLGLKRSWSYSGRFFRLKKGTYHWYVWPGFGPRSKSRYGQLLGQSAFTVR